MVLRRMFKSSLLVLLSVLGISASALDYSVTDPAWVFSGRLSEEADQFLTESNIEFNEKQKYLHEKYLSD